MDYIAALIYDTLLHLNAIFSIANLIELLVIYSPKSIDLQHGFDLPHALVLVLFCVNIFRLCLIKYDISSYY